METDAGLGDGEVSVRSTGAQGAGTWLGGRFGLPERHLGADTQGGGGAACALTTLPSDDIACGVSSRLLRSLAHIYGSCPQP